MKEYVWYKDGKEFQRSKDIEGKLVTKKITGVDTYVEYKYYYDGSIKYEDYYKNGELHRDGDKPATIYYNEDGSINYEAHLKNGELHRDGDKPAYFSYHKDGSIKYMEYYRDGVEYTPN